MKIFFDLIVAMDLNSGIGKDGRLPWHLPVDLKHFKQLTTVVRSSNKKNAVVMGRKTWESLPEKFRPLPGRINAVITRNKDLILPAGILKGDSLESVLDRLSAMTEGPENIFVIGGAQIFAQAIHHPGCRKIYLTRIFQKFDCDTFFPPFDPSWAQTFASPQALDQGMTYAFLEYAKRKE